MIKLHIHRQPVSRNYPIKNLENRYVVCNLVPLLLSNTFGNPNQIADFLLLQLQPSVKHPIVKLLLKGLLAQMDLVLEELVF